MIVSYESETKEEDARGVRQERVMKMADTGRRQQLTSSCARCGASHCPMSTAHRAEQCTQNTQKQHDPEQIRLADSDWRLNQPKQAQPPSRKQARPTTWADQHEQANPNWCLCRHFSLRVPRLCVPPLVPHHPRLQLAQTAACSSINSGTHHCTINWGEALGRSCRPLPIADRPALSRHKNQ